MANVLASKETYNTAENIIIQYLRDSGFKGSTEDGTGLYDVVVKPSSLIYSLFRQSADKAQAYMSLSKAYELRGVLTQDEYDAAVDGIMSNWFVFRHQGMPASGLVRMWYSEPPEFLSFRQGTLLGRHEDLTLFVRETVSFTPGDESTPSDYGSVVNTAMNSTEYYVDVPVIAGMSGQVSIPAGTPVSVVPSHIYFLRATAAYDFDGGLDPESSEDFILRTSEAITTRELITDRAIRTVLPDRFPDIQRLYIAGHGVPEMVRDVKTFQGVDVHVGNMADLWIASQLVRVRETAAIEEGGLVRLSTKPVHILSVIPEGSTEPCEYAVQADPHSWLSPAEPAELVLTLPEGSTAAKAAVTCLTSNVPAAVHDFVCGETARAASYDPKVRMMTPVVLHITMRISSKKMDDDALYAIRRAVFLYVQNISRAGKTWAESEMVQAIHNAAPFVDAVYLPAECTASFFDIGSGTVTEMPVSSRFVLPEGISPQITENTIQFYTAEDLISVEFV